MTTSQILRSLAVAALVAVLAAAYITPAHAAGSSHDRWRQVSATSTQESCSLTVTATYRRTSTGVILDSVLATDLRGWRPALSVQTAAGAYVYLGPNGHGDVGDGIDYEWTGGTETNRAGQRVPIGASDNNPDGWPAAGYRAPGGFTLRVSAPEWRYCGVELRVK